VKQSHILRIWQIQIIQLTDPVIFHSTWECAGLILKKKSLYGKGTL